MKLNLGAADRHLPGYLCVDIAPPPCAECDDPRMPEASRKFRAVDLSLMWQWPDSSVEEVMALDIIEHIGDVQEWHDRWKMIDYRPDADVPTLSRYGKIHFMNELHRVLAPGGRATIETPNAARGCAFWQDPTHVSGWCWSTFKYFESGAFAHQRLSKAYGITAAFKVLSLDEFRTNGEHPAEDAWKIKIVLEAIK